MRTILLTGATGFVGTRLLPMLLARGHAVIAAVRSVGDSRLVAKEQVGRLRYIEWGRGAAEFEAALARACMGTRLDSVINLVGYATVDHTAADVDALIEANFAAGVRAVDCAVRHGARTFIQAGSFWENGAGAACDMPNCLYASLKTALSVVLRHYIAQGRLESVLHLKLFDIYGESDPRGRLLALLVQAQRTGVTVRLSAGTQKIDLVHVDDVVAAFLLAEEQAATGGLSGHHEYSVNTRASRSVREVVALVEMVTERPVPVAWGARPARTVDTETPWSGGDWLPGWVPTVPLVEGIRRLATTDFIT